MRRRTAPRPRRRAMGVALLSVLLILSIATALAYRSASRHALAVAYGGLVLNGSQARHYALAGESYARQLLHADWEDPATRATDTLQEAWAGGGKAESPTAELSIDDFAIDGAAVALRIEDLAARFNLNAVLGPGPTGAQNMERFKRLLEHLELDPGIAERWRDWLDADADAQGLGAEDAAYLAAERPRRTAGQRALHASELLVPGELSAEAFERLRPFVTALPVYDQQVNLNTASAVVLGCLAPNFPPRQAEALVERAGEYDSIEAAIASHAALGESTGALAVASEFFRVQAYAEVNEVRAELTTVLHRDRSNGYVSVLGRSFGERFTAEEPAPEAVSGM